MFSIKSFMVVCQICHASTGTITTGMKLMGLWRPNAIVKSTCNVIFFIFIFENNVIFPYSNDLFRLLFFFLLFIVFFYSFLKKKKLMIEHSFTILWESSQYLTPYLINQNYPRPHYRFSQNNSIPNKFGNNQKHICYYINKNSHKFKPYLNKLQQWHKKALVKRLSFLNIGVV